MAADGKAEPVKAVSLSDEASFPATITREKKENDSTLGIAHLP